jgi:hypothetical protein
MFYSKIVFLNEKIIPVTDDPLIKPLTVVRQKAKPKKKQDACKCQDYRVSHDVNQCKKRWNEEKNKRLPSCSMSLAFFE